MDQKFICQLLLFGCTNLNVVENRIILKATMAYSMKATKSGFAFWFDGCGESFLFSGDSFCFVAFQMRGCILEEFIAHNPNDVLHAKPNL